MIAAPRFLKVGMNFFRFQLVVDERLYLLAVDFANGDPDTESPSGCPTPSSCDRRHGLADLLRDLGERAVVVEAHHRREVRGFVSAARFHAM